MQDKGCGRHPYKSGPGLTKDTRKKIIENNIGETIENERLFSTFGILEKFIYEVSPEGIIMMKGVTYDGMDEFVFMPKTIVSEAKEDSIIRNNLKKFKYDADNNLQNPEHKVYRAVISRGIDSRPFISDSTKTEAGVRDVPISKPLLPIIKKALADTKKNPYGLIFYDYIKGGIIETTQVNLFYRRLCEKADIPFNGQHALRHTFATRCIESGIPAVVLKHWLGHTDIHITLDTYSDVFDRMNSKAVEKFNSYMDTIYEC